ncbi:DUF3551 domain-containing protein [Bradyrhizobium sp. 2TAF24]|uniref:DUF3551 domain-containing protein n=1 Tax=Bradyrhizobium sp. 2TAF24 TaxID=3233011 RepID=UPI003F8F41D5
MKTIYSTLVLAALALGAVTASAAAKTDPAGPRGESFCLMGEGEEHCGFTSYAQCQASASGLGADCTIDLSADDRVRLMPARG